MVQLIDSDIQTREVLDWKGLHLFHFPASSCSQKTRIFLNLKGVDWESHIIDLSKNENFSDWYLGINPRGLVPTLVLDGEVHVESNDIITLLEERFPDPGLIPAGRESEMADLLRHEDDLHLDLRTISFRYTQQRPHPPKSPEAIDRYKEGGTGTVLGNADPNKQKEIDFWERVGQEGLTDGAIRTSAARFRASLDELDSALKDQPYLLGPSLTVLDIAWFIYVNRLVRCGYPLDRLHPNVAGWFEPLRNRPEFASEVQVPPEVQTAVEDNHKRQAAEGTTLVQVAGL